MDEYSLHPLVKGELGYLLVIAIISCTPNLSIVRTVLRPDDPMIPQVLEIDMGFNQCSAKP